MAQEYKTLLHRWFEEVWNQGREDAIDEMFAKDGIINGLNDPQGNPARSLEEYKGFFRAFRAAFPNIKVTVEDTVTEGDKIAARCTVKALHEGDGIGLAPTNMPVGFTGMTIVRLKNGKIAEAWNEFDFMKLYQQLGIVTLNQQ